MPPTDNIASLSNQELSRRLREYGVNVGPIVQTTRGLYEKKLRKLETGQEIRPQYEEVPDDDEDDGEEDEESEEEKEEISAQASRQAPNEPRRRVPTRVPTPSRGSRPAEPEMTSRTQQQTRSAPLTERKESKSKGFPVWTLLFVLLLLAGVGYLVVRNMEPEAQSNIPNQIEVEV